MTKTIRNLQRNLGKGLISSTHRKGKTSDKMYVYLIIQKMQMKTTMSFLFGLINQLKLQVLG